MPIVPRSDRDLRSDANRRFSPTLGELRKEKIEIWPGGCQEGEAVHPAHRSELLGRSWRRSTKMSEEFFVGTELQTYPIWTRANVGEVFPDPVALATFDFAFQNESGLR